MIAEWVRTNGKCTNCGDYPFPEWVGTAYMTDKREQLAFFCRKDECHGAAQRFWEARDQ